MKALFSTLVKGAVFYLTLLVITVSSVRAIEEQVRVFYGTTGNATGYVEYICVSAPASSTDEAKWIIRKLIYDASGNVTSVLYADDDSSANKICDDRAGYYYNE
jgi:hypothetical protein